MSDLEYLIGVVAPRLIGLALIVYSFFLVYRVRMRFFAVIRGLVVVSFVTTVMLLWIYETAFFLVGGENHAHHPFIGICFVVVTSWLSVWTVAITTRYRDHFTTSAFRKWISAKPVNPITAWGATGILVLVVALVADAIGERDSGSSGWLLAIVLGYLLTSAALGVAMPISAKRRGDLRRLTPKEKWGMALLASSWIGIPSVEYFFHVYHVHATGAIYDYVYSWMMFAMFVFILKSVTGGRFNALIVDAEVEMTEQGGFRSYDIPRGVYLFEDENSSSATNLFVELVTLPLRPDVAIPKKESATSDTLAFLIPKGL
ncbi:MAG: hypothetical protein LN409_04885, partial [Candidatus Thermoplasmatota archaeon]|nr:hypothetical protein [Candidatus Thermoplasmatota archaeon]